MLLKVPDSPPSPELTDEERHEQLVGFCWRNGAYLFGAFLAAIIVMAIDPKLWWAALAIMVSLGLLWRFDKHCGHQEVKHFRNDNR